MNDAPITRRTLLKSIGMTAGAAVMYRYTFLIWGARAATPGSRVVNFTRTGEKRFAALFGSQPA